jgi:ribose 5-phosphate isomerase B
MVAKSTCYLDKAHSAIYETTMKIALGTDHAGFRYKEKVKELLGSLGHEVTDLGTFNEDPVDYPLFIRPAAEAVARGECERGIVFGGSGNGEAMTANKVHGIRCALCWNEEVARLSRQHNNANVLSLGQRVIAEDMALKIVRIWLETPFEGGRHERRVEQLNAM